MFRDIVAVGARRQLRRQNRGSVLIERMKVRR